ncbi:hypothetical protein ACWGOQ_0016405 [Aquimarina sp. M1]
MNTLDQLFWESPFTEMVIKVSTTYCFVIVLILIIQKKGYLKHTFFSIAMLLSTVLFVIASAMFFKYQYDKYRRLESRNDEYLAPQNMFKTEGSEPYINSLKNELEELRFSIEDLTLLSEWKENRNGIMGYETSLLSSAKSFDEDDFSMQNILKETVITQFENEEYSQQYWNKVFNIVFGYIEEKDYYNSPHYQATAIIPVTYEKSNYSTNGTEMSPAHYKYIEEEGNTAYIQRKIKSTIRSKNNIENFWTKNKAFIYTFFSKSKYDELCKPVVDDLIDIHDKITKELGYRAFYAKYDEQDSTFINFHSKKFPETYYISWPFGFWDRRFGENNDETVYKVLKEIQEHYSE